MKAQFSSLMLAMTVMIHGKHPTVVIARAAKQSRGLVKPKM